MEEGKEKGGNGRDKEKKEEKKARREEKRKEGNNTATCQHKWHLSHWSSLQAEP